MTDDAEWDRIWKTLPSAALQGHRDTLPGPLYHYTNRAGFEGILTSKEIHAKHFKALEDTREVLLGYVDVIAVLEYEMKHYKGDEVVCEVLKNAMQPFEVALKGRGRSGRSLDYYVTSFTHRADWPHLWREYADGGSGFALGFDELHECGENVLPKDRSLASLLRCEYSEQAFRERVLALIRTQLFLIRDAWNALTSPKDKRRLKEEIAPLLLTAHLLTVATARKDPLFELEQEWRVTVISFTSNGTPPYIGLPFARDASTSGGITSVRLGPCQAPRDIDTLASRLEDCGYNPSSLERSKHPCANPSP